MNGFGQTAKSLARNPLGIIALFLVLVYGMACLVAGIGNFEPGERQPLIWFIVFFPVGILVAFYLLVSRHHVKLYAPSDFRTDESFLRPLTPEQNKARIEREVTFHGDIHLGSVKAQGEIHVENAKEAANEYFVAETLAIRQLESQMGRGISHGGFSYGVINPPAIFDATVTHNGSIYCIEVKLLKSPKEARDKLNNSIKEFDRVMQEYCNPFKTVVSTVLMLVVVVDFPLREVEPELQRIKERFLICPKALSFELRVYSFQELKERFGLS